MTRKCRRQGCARAGRALRRRYGCFRLPEVPGATVKENTRKDVTWLARTDPEAKEIELSHAWAALPSPLARKYILLHERAHLETGTDHNDQFYQALKKLIVANKVPWKIAFELESYNCHAKH
jgi:hypothetical protein